VIAGVVDTHATLWYLLGNTLLSPAARTFMDRVAAAGDRILLSPISLAEIIYLTEKGRLSASAYDELKEALADDDYVIDQAPFTADVVDAMRQISRSAVPDLPDRIVAATAIYLNVPLVSRDGRIRASNVRTIW